MCLQKEHLTAMVEQLKKQPELMQWLVEQVAGEKAYIDHVPTALCYCCGTAYYLDGICTACPGEPDEDPDPQGLCEPEAYDDTVHANTNCCHCFAPVTDGQDYCSKECFLQDMGGSYDNDGQWLPF